MSVIKVLIADDHPILREGVRRLLEAESDIIVAGEAADGREALKKLEKLQADVVLLDISMPGMSGLEATRTIRQMHPETQVVVLSMHEKAIYVNRMLQAGALGYLLKGSAVPHIAKAIRAVHQGEYYLCPRIRTDVITNFLKGRKEGTPVRQYDLLSDREQQVFRLLAEGHSTGEIAEMLCVSPKTVEKHRVNVMKKLGFKNVVEMVKYAISIGVIDVDFWEN